MMQRSSTHRATCGNSSLTAIPLSPYCWNFQGEPSSFPVSANWTRGFANGKRLAVVALEQRLVVERIDVRRPPLHEQEDDPLGPGGEVRRARARAGP